MLKYLQQTVHGMHQLDIPVCSLKPLAVAVGLVLHTMTMLVLAEAGLVPEDGLPLKLLELLSQSSEGMVGLLGH